MSQKVQIKGFKLIGHAYAGNDDQGDPSYLRDGLAVAKWLAHNSRVRFNQQRSLRSKYVYEDNVRQLDAAGNPVLEPIGDTVTSLTPGQVKAQIPWMASMPSMVMMHAQRDENTSWFAAAKRRKTNAGKGSKGGRMPRFKSKYGTLSFGCFARNGAQQTVFFAKTGRRSGVLTIRGFNPKHAITDKHPRAWSLRIRIRIPVKMAINDFTSIQANLDSMTLVFVGEPPAREHTPTSKIAGVDRGVAVVLATNDGQLLNPTENQTSTLKELGNRYKRNQRSMARSQIVAEAEGRDFRKSRRYQKLKVEGRKISTRANNIRNDWRHKTTTQLIIDYDYLALEKLNLKNMTRSAKGTVEKPGKNVAQKRGLNRALAGAAPAMLMGMIKYKAKASGVHTVEVNPRWTSQRCNACGHIDEGNRKNQAFLCLDCGHKDHADINAAKNVLDLALGAWDGTRSNRAREWKTESSLLASAAPAGTR